jgi:hypothetical protein
MPDILARNDGKKAVRTPAPAAAPAASTSLPRKESPTMVIRRGFVDEQNGKIITGRNNVSIRCNWCDQEIAKIHMPDLDDLVGPDVPRNKDGLVQMVYNYDPCTKCAESWKPFITVIEVTDVEPYPDALVLSEMNGKNYYPTKRRVGLIPEKVAELMKDILPGETFNAGDIRFMTTDDFEAAFGDLFDELDDE